MIEKKELIKLLKEALVTEEKAIPIYTKHLKSAIFWTGLEKDEMEKAKGLLKELAEGSAGHKKAVERLIKDIREKNKDAL